MALDTVQDLLTAIDTLPHPDGGNARLRVEAALAKPAPAAWAALGLLALEIAGAVEQANLADDASTDQGPDGGPRIPEWSSGRVIMLPEPEPATIAATA